MWANPLYRGNVIRWNDFERVAGETGGSYGAAAVRHDDFISGFMTTENLFRGGGRGSHFGSVQFNRGTDNWVEGNLIVDWDQAFSGRSIAGKAWSDAVLGHPHSKQMLNTTPWKSEAWQRRYPKVRNQLEGDDNHNYLVGNLRLGLGKWGSVGRGVFLANREGDSEVHGNTVESLKPLLFPWYPIPIDRIGLYGP